MNINRMDSDQIAEVAKTKSNKFENVCIRGIITYHARQLGMTLRSIGEMLNKDHSTIAHYIRMHNPNMRSSHVYRYFFKELTKDRVLKIIESL